MSGPADARVRLRYDGLLQGFGRGALLAHIPLRKRLEICTLYAYTGSVDVTWDPEKARDNLRKHGVRFSDAESVLFDPGALTREDTAAEGEQRLVTLGADPIGRILVVVYTYRGEDIRLISAWQATKKERRHYEEGI